MANLGTNFIKCAVIYGLIGMGLGIFMAASGDHSQMPTHTHLNLLGWVSMALFGLAYYTMPALTAGALPKIHFWLMNAGVVGMIVGLFLMFSGNMQFAMLTAASSVLVLLGMLLFAIIFYRTKTA